MTTIITLPTKDNILRWLNISNEILPYIETTKKLIVDFQNVTFLETRNLVLLACYLEYFYKKNVIIEFKNISPKIQYHLNNINFEDYFKLNNRGNFFTPKNSTTIPLWNIKQAEGYSYSTFAQSFLQNHFNNKNLLFVQSNLYEIFNNIFDHAESQIGGFVITQYYPNINQISYSICDLGVGIPSTINNMRISKNESVLSDGEAIKLSTELKVTAKSKPHNAGLGLNSIIDICQNKLGNVQIFSNKGYYYTGFNGVAQDLNTTFIGTLININIDTRKLEEDDEEIEFFDNF
ncbi:hypothetical protein P3875_01220 [Myroides sp. JBRI-B21084]|uniref:hypothetical protein n=1 Tax=Myroides sp. JBRI-B21084 TaxID=3119977 RepID=UPI0026E37B15|nr:hypothetical protein [Paenimyroides cloacae]WKW46721.1 hypothetical protein P3875_01220 [Paenimyroides cloacae]